MNNEQYQALCSQHPELTIQGWGISLDPNKPYTAKTKAKMRKDARQDLLDARLPFEYCCQWIDQNPALPGLRTSYHWKHQVQPWAEGLQLESTYIGEGAFTLAAIYKGYKIHRIKNSTGARIEP